MYALNLSDDGRILSVTYPEYAPEDAVIIDTLPDGDITDYLHIDGAFVYDPLPVPVPEPTPEERVAELESLLDLLLGVNDDE